MRVADNAAVLEHSELIKLMRFPYVKSGITIETRSVAFDALDVSSVTDRLPTTPALPTITGKKIHFLLFRHSKGTGLIIVDTILQSIHFADGYFMEWSATLRNKIKRELSLPGSTQCIIPRGITASTDTAKERRSGPFCVYAAHSYVINHPAMVRGVSVGDVRPISVPRTCPTLHVNGREFLEFWKLMTYTPTP